MNALAERAVQMKALQADKHAALVSVAQAEAQGHYRTANAYLRHALEAEEHYSALRAGRVA